MKPQYALLERLRKGYRDYVYAHVQDWARGSNWLLRIMTGAMIEQFRKGDNYCYPHDVELCFAEKGHLNPTLIGDVIRGYLRRYDVEEGDVIVDGGAYVGTFAIYCAKQGAEVIAVEPDSDNAEQLRTNLRLNGVEDSVTVVEKALWEEEGTVSFEAAESEASAVSDEGDVDVAATTLNVLAEEHGPFDFIKLDIEGAELEALRGAEAILSQGVPFAIETQETVDGEPVWKPIEAFFRDNDYETETGYPLHRTTWAWKL